MSKEWRKISDAFWFQEGPGVRKYQYRESGVKLLNVANLVKGKVDISNTSRYISEEEAYGKYRHFLVDEGDFIIASSGIKVEYFDEKMGFVSADDLPLCMNTSTIRFKSLNPSMDDVRYLMYYLKSISFKRQLAKQITGSAQLNFGPSHLKRMGFPHCGIDEQKEVVSKLDHITGLIDASTLELERLDQLVKSRFVEMFGDQKLNQKGFPLGELQDVADIFLGLTHTPKYVDEGRPFLSVRDISNGTIDFSKCHYITEEEFQSLPKGAKPQAGDLLFCRVGTIGKPVIVPNGTPEFGSFVSVGFLRRKINVLNEYLKAWMEDPNFMIQVNNHVSGASQVNLNTGWLKQFSIIIPPLTLQQEFATFVAQVDKSKFAVQRSIEQLELLKAKLMQEYFG